MPVEKRAKEYRQWWEDVGTMNLAKAMAMSDEEYEHHQQQFEVQQEAQWSD